MIIKPIKSETDYENALKRLEIISLESAVGNML